jgi:two-component system, LytTR family, sensor kinase
MEKMMWTRIKTVLKRDQFGFPSFWQLQAAGSIGFWLLALACVLPSHSSQEFRQQTIFSATVFLASSLLRPVCRSLYRRSMPWLALEAYAFGCSAALGAAATFISELVKLRKLDLIWPNFTDEWVSFSVVLFLWCTLYFSIKQWQQTMREREQLSLHRERLAQAEAEAREARLNSLRYQLNPHFLFNSLNAVSTLVLAGKTSEATRMLAQIGELLRTTLDSNALPEIPLSQEMAFVEQYLAIEQTRLGNRLRIETRISPNSLDAAVPTMLLQPLVENAVRHGVAPTVSGGTVEIESTLKDDRLRIAIKNSAAGIRDIHFQNGSASKSIGLANTAERLKVLYGDAHRFELQSAGECDWQVTVEIPLQRIASDAEENLCAH